MHMCSFCQDASTIHMEHDIDLDKYLPRSFCDLDLGWSGVKVTKLPFGSKDT